MLLGNWFEKKRTLAYSISAASTGLSTLGITSLITWSNEKNGLGRTFLTEAVAAAALTLIFALSAVLLIACIQMIFRRSHHDDAL